MHGHRAVNRCCMLNARTPFSQKVQSKVVVQCVNVVQSTGAGEKCGNNYSA